MSKKILSLILAFLTVAFMIIDSPFLMFASTSHTQAQAVSWAGSQIGKSLDYDGMYGAQCVDLIKFYYEYLGVSPVRGNGADYASNSLPSGWTRIADSSGKKARAGDIAVWTYTSSKNGHVALVTGVTKTGLNIVDQNWEVAGSTSSRSMTYSYLASYGSKSRPNYKFYGFIRPDFSNVTVVSGKKQSNLDGDVELDGKKGAVDVNGWALDKNNTDDKLEVNLYIDGDAGKGELHTLTADGEYKSDSSLDTHGIDETLSTKKAGNCDIYVYATNNSTGAVKQIKKAKDVKITEKAHTNIRTVTKKATKSSDGSYKTTCKTCGKVTGSGTIHKIKSVKAAASKIVYTGKSIVPAAVVTDSKGKTVGKKHYTISGAKKTPGKYTATVTMKGDYSGKFTFTYYILPKGTSVKSLSTKSGAIGVSWTNQKTQTSGYQIQYSVNKNMKGAKTSTVKNNNTNYRTLWNLKHKKTYYIRIRTYKTVNGKNYFSTWSTVKFKKTK